VPSAAEVPLGDAEAFEELRRLTAPRVEYRDSWWPTFTWFTGLQASRGLDAAAPVGAAVDGLGRQRIGPFDVTRLAARDPPRWHGGWPASASRASRTPTGSTPTWRPPADAAVTLGDPPQTVDLYVLAAHRMDPTSVPGRARRLRRQRSVSDALDRLHRHTVVDRR